MAIALDKNTRDLADATGFVIDRTLGQEKVIGQAWLISKSRVLVKASAVSLYSEAPWALVVRFPYPNLTYFVKTISLHPDFNKRQLREAYLNQGAEPDWASGLYANDIATLTLDTETAEFAPERVQELNRALSLPLNVSPNELSGAVRPGDAGPILHNALASGRSGFLNFYDERRIPYARLLIRQGKMLYAMFKTLINEYAVCELFCQKSTGNFVLHSNDSFVWPSIPQIATGTEQLINEAARRTAEIPKLLGALGGAEARFIRCSVDVDLNQFPQQTRWIKERLLGAVNGFMPAAKMGERIGVDTYTALQGLWELRQQSLIELAGENPFHASGQLGPQLVPGGDVDLAVWDDIAAFYLDELSCAPVVLAGNYIGPNSLLSPKALMHNIPMKAVSHGAAMVKSGRLIGLHCGKAPDHSPMEVGQMSWVGTLGDMGAKRLRATAESVLEMPEAEPSSSSVPKISPAPARLRMQSEDELPPSETPPPAKNGSEPAFLEKFSKLHIFIAAAVMFVLAFLMFVNSMFFSAKQVVSAPAITRSSAPEKKPETPSVRKATEVATTLAEFKDSPCPPYEFEDTSAITDPKPSFGLNSKQQNQKILCVLWPNHSPVDTVAAMESQLPFLNYKTDPEPGVQVLVQAGETGRITWAARRYITKDSKKVVVLVGAYPSAKANHCILILAQPYNGEGVVDFQTTLGVLQRMLIEKEPVKTEETTEPANSPKESESQPQN